MYSRFLVLGMLLLQACLVQETIHKREESTVSSAEATASKVRDFLFDVGTTRSFEESLRIENGMQSQVIKLTRNISAAQTVAKQVERAAIAESIDLNGMANDSFTFTDIRDFNLDRKPHPDSITVTGEMIGEIALFTVSGRLLSIDPSVDLSPGETITVSYQYSKSQFDLEKKPAPESLILSIDGVVLPRDQYTLAEQNVRLSLLPPPGVTIDAHYLEFQALLTKIDLPDNVISDTITVKYDDKQITADDVRFDEPTHSLELVLIPADGVMITVDYSIDQGPKLAYPFNFQPVSDNSIELIDASSGEPITFDLENSQIVISLAEHTPERELLLRYKKQSDIAQDYQLSHEPIGDQFSMGFDNESCLSGSGITRSGRKLRIDCELEGITTVRMIYAYLTTRTRFSIANISDPDNGVWEVYFNEEKTANWQREGNTIIVPDDLDASTRVRVRFNEGKQHKQAG